MTIDRHADLGELLVFEGRAAIAAIVQKALDRPGIVYGRAVDATNAAVRAE
jgi:hypothetical protein